MLTRAQYHTQLTIRSTQPLSDHPSHRLGGGREHGQQTEYTEQHGRRQVTDRLALPGAAVAPEAYAGVAQLHSER